MTSGIEKQAAFYRGYLIDDQSLAPLAVALATIVAIWFLVYVAGSIGPLAQPRRAPVAAQWPAVARSASP